jgi:histidine triad (HIT) family protein
VFCKIVSEQSPATILRQWPDAIAITPLGPVVDGHVLIIPRWHVEDVAYDASVTSMVMRRVADYINEFDVGECNVITSRGVNATQTVFHMHVHIVPRRELDGLLLPWSKHD